MSASEAETVCTLLPIEVVSWMVTRYSELKKMGACWFLMMVTFTTAWLAADRGGWPWSLKLILICTAEKEKSQFVHFLDMFYNFSSASKFDIMQIIQMLWRIVIASFLAVSELAHALTVNWDWLVWVGDWRRETAPELETWKYCKAWPSPTME